MTRRGVLALTTGSLALYLFLAWAFADDLFTAKFWDGHAIADSSLWTYVTIAAIVIAGALKYRTAPDVAPEVTPQVPEEGQIEDPRLWKLLLGNVHFAIFWLPIRLFVGRDWIAAGEHKLRDDAWMDGGAALKGFWIGKTTVPDGQSAAPSGTYGWFQDFLTYMLNNEWYTWFAKVIAIGEFLVGVGLVVGALVGIAAFFGTMMNFNFMLAGTTSSNPVLFGLGVFLVLGWKTAGWLGIDRVLLPILRTPWGRFEARKIKVNLAPPIQKPALQ
ncbi:MAG: DoxX family membrane protein [Chloroflexota bacterium]|nr:DoxX family membrane protein [Chloroflexota bacterium]